MGTEDDTVVGPVPIWNPDPKVVADAAVTRFGRYVTECTGTTFDSYLDLWAWSVDHLEQFWATIWDYFEILADGHPTTVLAESSMPGARWFLGTRLNYAEHALRYGADDTVAVTAVAEDGTTTRTTRGQLRAQVAAVSGWLREAGVHPGDRVVGYLPNTTETLVAFLAAASIGAVWSACAQDYSAHGAAARFAQLEPVVLFAADGYSWNGRSYDRRSEVTALQQALPTLRATVHVPNLGLPIDIEADSGGTHATWEQATARSAELRFEQVAFDAPLWVLFSSGTTGLPKGIVHGHGGVLLEHLKMLALHLDVGPSKPLFWYTTTNWMMWNIVASGLLVGAPIVLYDGSPSYPDTARLWQVAAAEQVAMLGVSPGYLLASAKAGLQPGRELDLRALRTIGATGAPLSAASYQWVHDAVGPSIQLASTSGGTDVVGGFAGSAPTTPVWAGEISAPNLGVALEAWNEAGQPVVGEVGELVVTKPMPSMPLYFWNDPDGERYRDAYFATYPGVWRHGDWMQVTEHGSVIVSGRSDSTLNRHGVRLGSADIYDAVDKLPQITDSLVVGAELGGGRYWLVLFVVLADDSTLDGELTSEIEQAIATSASPRHVPDDIITLDTLPHTRTGKRLEVPAKRLIQGHALATVASRDAVDNFDALAQFTKYAGGPARPGSAPPA
ncbi:acetoacetate--CoA ligase [Nocardioides panzhihuensis]|uniref:Acetoacetyl-CoA synthetase n=1 Tax=Nocardioides panzhihuensis TaxID=860243 RepID=A0A7Z0DLV5_9ACTN|nr:acetoacetate--CoA ligase [Nocardioides panzhihuensis]NYI77694.1 acetoacetyl-CoA synthetase [Nocardioides panzhihuensis]